MIAVRTDALLAILEELDASSADIQAAAVISADGLMLASMLPQGLDEDRVGAMSAALLSLGTRVANDLHRGAPEQVLVKGGHGYVIMLQAGPDAVLTVLASSAARLGLVILEAQRAAVSLAGVP